MLHICAYEFYFKIMTDDIKDNELDEEVSANAEPDFLPNVAPPVLDDDSIDDDPHASFNPVNIVEDDAEADPYGVGAPKVGNHEDYEDDEETEDLDEVFSASDTEAY